MFMFWMFSSSQSVCAQDPWPVLEGIEAWPEIMREAETLIASKTALPEGNLRQSMRLNGWWNRKTGDDGPWERVMVPDVWHQTGAPHHKWYVRRFTVPSVFSGKRLIIEFGAIRQYAEVFLNGQRMGTHAGGFTPFRLDVTETAYTGSVNTLVIYVKDDTYAKHGNRVYHQVGVSDIIRGGADSAEGGIWQDVRLLGLPAVHVSDIFVRTSTRRNMLEATITVRNDGDEASDITIAPSVLVWPDATPVSLQVPALYGSVPPGGERAFELRHLWPNPRLWSPDHPHLYRLQTNVSAESESGLLQDSSSVRFGFREFWIDGANFYLNGVRTRLRGDSDPVGSAREPFLWRSDFTRRLMQIMKKDIGLNALRIHATTGPPAIFDAADEVGVLLINQSSIWSLGKRWYHRGGERLLENTRIEFEAWIKRDRNHPSVVIWDAENEMIRNDMNEWDWVRRLPGYIRPFDETRPIIHSGSGGCHPSMSVYHIHHHENYSALYDAYNRNRDKPMLAGEYWVGGRNGERRLTSGEEFFSYNDYLQRSALLWKERMDEQRVNGLAGIMPYYWMSNWGSRLLLPLPSGPPIQWPDPTAPEIKPSEAPWFLHLKDWELPGSEYKMFPEVADAFRLGLSPLHVAFKENSGNYYAGEVLKKTAVVSNDLETGRELTVAWQLMDGDNILQRDAHRQWVNAGDQWTLPLEIIMPETSQAKNLNLHTSVVSDDQYESHDELIVSLYPMNTRALPALTRRIGIFDPAGSLKPMLEQAGDHYRVVHDLKTNEFPDILIIGEHVNPAVVEDAGARLRNYVRDGGRLLLMQQESAPDWLNAGLDIFEVPSIQSHNEFRLFDFGEVEKAVFQSRYAVVHSPAHPVLQGIPDGILRWWRSGDGRIADDILVRPKTREQTALHNMRSILGGARREYSSLLEVMPGDGVALYSQLELMDNYQIDPAATRLLHNMLTYMQEWQPLQSTAGVVSVGIEHAGALEPWMTSLDNFPDAIPSCRALLIGPAVRMTVQQVDAVDRFVKEGGVAFYTPGAPLPLPLARKVQVVEPDTVATILNIRRYSNIISGFNSFDCEHWTVPPVSMVMRLQSEPATGGLLQAGAVDHTNRGNGRQIDHLNYRTLGLALVEFPTGRGSYIISQLPLPEADNYQACAVYAAIFTNLGIKLPE
jgi:hypothetical protein